mmetsp:Transcript_10469/g.31278  ORF Transcript_10469/g.31278 Transcript_10469/m.31278 type:complete len:103 (-) Transcript_10469:36-344(-)
MTASPKATSAEWAAVQFVAEWAAATRRPPHSTAVASERLCMVAEQGVLCRVGKRQRATGFVPGTTLRALRALPQWASWANGEAARLPEPAVPSALSRVSAAH